MISRSYVRATAPRFGSLEPSWTSTSSIAGSASAYCSIDELLDAAWSDVPAELRPVAAVSLLAHLDKLEDERRLPADVERPSW